MSANDWIARAKVLRADGWSYPKIGKTVGKSETHVRRAVLEQKRDRRAETKHRTMIAEHNADAVIDRRRQPRQVYDRAAVTEFLAKQITYEQLKARIRA